MKNIALGIAASLLIAGCATTAPAPAPVPAAPAKSTKKPEEIKTMQVTGFETASKPATYVGPGSTVAPTFVTDDVHEGKQALKIDYETASWAGTVLSPGKEKGNWTGMTTFKLWVKGGNSGNKFELQLQDAQDELFITRVQDNFTGWKQLVIPLSEFKHRNDYQNPTAKSNEAIDYPLRNIQISTNQGSGGKGSIKLVIDDLTVTDE
jgi:hypothetical protein